MKKQAPSLSRLLSIVAIAGVLITQVVSTTLVSAAQITNRSLTLQAGVTDGGSKPSGVVNHRFDFSVPNGPSVGSVKLEYCMTASGACTMPTGLLTTSSTLGLNSGAISGLSLVNTTNGAPYLTRTAAAVTAGAVAIRLDGVTNPSTANQTFFVRITTYGSTDTTGSAIDLGAVTASTTQQILLDGTMPESLVFCTGATISLNGGVPDCSTATSGAISFNQLFSPTDTATAASQMAASTNAGAGYAITVNGPTLTSGANTITAMGPATAGVHGISQFGMNLRANTVTTSTVPIGTEVAPIANGTNYRGQAAASYNTIDSFKFASGDVVANSANGGAGGTDAQIFTASYMVNVPGSQPAGTYTTTLTYICTPTF